MPDPNPQQMQIQKPLHDLQLLARLSSNPLARTILTSLTHHQLVLIGVAFIVTLLFTIQDNAPWVTVRKDAAAEFFSAVSQSLAALLGVLIVFLTFTSQLIAQNRLDNYRALQVQIDQLIVLTRELPPTLSTFAETLEEIINYLVPLQMKDFPTWASARSGSALGMLIENLKNEWVEIEQLPLATRLYLQHILLVLNSIEEILEVFSTLYVRILEMSRFIFAIAKLSFLLGVSLLFLLLFGIVGLQTQFPDLSLPVIVALALWVLIALLELVLDAWNLYKNLHGPWNHLTHHRIKLPDL